MKESKGKIRFNYLEKGFALPERSLLKAFILSLFKKEKRSVDTVNYIFCSDDYLIELNRQHLNHDTYTDIITFELSAKGEPVLSDIYISIDRVKENALSFKSTFQEELHRVIFHGALHLCGYKDKSKADSAAMRKMEDKYLNLYFVPRGTKN